MNYEKKNILGRNEPKKLLRTIYFLVGKHFALRNRREHHDFRHGIGSQIKIVGLEQEKKLIYKSCQNLMMGD